MIFYRLTMTYDHIQMANNILASRAKLPRIADSGKCDEEGGCGVTGFISSIQVSGKNIYEPSVQMHNRGNGKGGGIAAVGLCPEDLGVTREVLDSHYLLQIAYLDESARADVEKSHVLPFMDIQTASVTPSIDDYKEIGLEVKPPEVWRYFVRVKKDVLAAFIEKNGFTGSDPRKVEDEFISENSVSLNHQYYASLDDKKAFVMSHGRDIMILKIVGYAEQVTQYYCLDDFKAHGWIAHQRYPTRGRLWHPGGAHPFSGMHEALVHNGDFANYHAISEYLKQRNLFPQFLTDTELSALLLDLYNRVFEYPMEYIIEALAPTSEYDFDRLAVEKQKIYKAIQSQHIPGSPDGPWFFIIARNDPYNHFLQLIGITDTAMLRPQVFALQENEDVQIGLVCSEKQAIDATLENLAAEDDRFCPVADKYWNARGGSATDGGAFTFTLTDSGKGDGSKKLTAANKFGEIVTASSSRKKAGFAAEISIAPHAEEISADVEAGLASNEIDPFVNNWAAKIKEWGFGDVKSLCSEIVKKSGQSARHTANAIDALTRLNDRIFPTGSKKRSLILHIVRGGLTQIFNAFPTLDENGESAWSRIDWETRSAIRAPKKNEKTLVLNARNFQPEGQNCDSRVINRAYELGWKQFICHGYKGQRFTGCGLGTGSEGVRIDVYDSSGDYLASGISGMEIYVHGNAQDQLGQIMKSGKLVVYGDVGQTFMYGAKGGDVYVMGNAAGRPLINAVGSPKVVINGTCLDYLAESFMAGDPLNGGGFVILNGIEFDEDGSVISQPNPYPGSNLFSLASGGAIYLRDPEKMAAPEQLNGGEIVDLTPADWELILPILDENERLFGVRVEADLLTIDGIKKSYADVYRKVQPIKVGVLSKTAFSEGEGEGEWG